jgi:hypothetical protein
LLAAQQQQQQWMQQQLRQQQQSFELHLQQTAEALQAGVAAQLQASQTFVLDPTWLQSNQPQ